ncbi:GreA/GreB family elongation factor [Spirosoma validum]|uniref:GreA/GreB family elongation factor n=1 Tax=Spirosoma validum TaxID=2771355 RepID=A0A927B3E9_9BACT|nr:GreA/GreB family elongation factor [Spirosoma validum]MBD2754512.1 GreA/GreB family elongation factor [Spirosoma validum]
MSRAFLKNESADDPVVIPARAPLPPGATNYVTPRGLIMLRSELEKLEAERAQAQSNQLDEVERTRHVAELNGRIGALNQRIASAKVVDHQSHSHDQTTDPIVRFGATVSLHSRTTNSADADRRLTIVGVDEANAAQGLIAFTAPIARLLLGRQVGDLISLRTPQGENSLEITSISYGK